MVIPDGVLIPLWPRVRRSVLRMPAFLGNQVRLRHLLRTAVLELSAVVAPVAVPVVDWKDRYARFSLPRPRMSGLQSVRLLPSRRVRRFCLFRKAVLFE